MTMTLKKIWISEGSRRSPVVSIGADIADCFGVPTIGCSMILEGKNAIQPTSGEHRFCLF